MTEGIMSSEIAASRSGDEEEQKLGELYRARLAFLSRLAGFGLGEATERLLVAGGVLPAGRRGAPPKPLPKG